ncbi:MAG TPA: hypothetical protein VM557_09790 [Thermoanaerobaculia bacterium]|nr:hypothetical protein [Thermoanaerobaculia bacterium]
MSALVSFLQQRPEAFAFLPPTELGRTVDELFQQPDWILPRPYKIFLADEVQQPMLGFPVQDSTVIKDLEARLERWIGDEIAWNLDRAYQRDKVRNSFTSYVQHATKLAENAMLSNLLADYHAVFWLAHSLQLSRQFSSIPRKVGALDPQLGRTQGDTIKYRIWAKWSSELREQMTLLAQRTRPILDGEEERGLQFFRLLQENLLILTEEFVSPDLRELRSFVVGYLHRDFQAFRDSIDRLFTLTADLQKRDTSFRNGIALFGAVPGERIPLGLLLDKRFQTFIFSHPSIENSFNRDERENLQSIARRVAEFTILHQLRRAIVWMTVSQDGDVRPADRRAESYSRSTRPLDFGRPGVVDPMVHRFGLIYDITSFSEILGNLARAGRAQELSSYRQMLLFQRKIESITERHRLQFEKFLGDGALYTTRRALNLVRSGVEIQRFYAEMKRKGFAFNRGIRIAINYGYYRILPMKPKLDSNERTMEFYGPGVVELSRLTTGKATKELEDIQSFLISHGYDSQHVQQFFAPLARGVDVVNREQHEREFFAYIDANHHLVNEGIVASIGLIQELASELATTGTQFFRFPATWDHYVGFSAGLDGIEFLGIRLLGSVALKGLADIEVAEIVPFVPGAVEAIPAEPGESLIGLLRQNYHDRESGGPGKKRAGDNSRTRERKVKTEIVLCATCGEHSDESNVMIGEWDPVTNEIRRSIIIPPSYLQNLGLASPLTTAAVEQSKSSLHDFYRRMKEYENALEDAATPLRRNRDTVAFLLGDVVEQL